MDLVVLDDLCLRAGIDNPNIEFVGINDLVPPDNLAYLFKYDSTHGKLKSKVEARKTVSLLMDISSLACL